MSTLTLEAPAAERTRSASWPKPSAVAWVLGAGLLLRLTHYLLNHTIWYDEAVLLANVLGKEYLRLLGPLDSEVAAPPFFLWSLRTIALTVGDYSYVWRLPFFVASCLTLALMTALARKTLPPAAAAILVALVAFSDSFVWLGCNVKPYIVDALFAAGILYGYVQTEQWSPSRRMLLFAAVAPILLCYSYATLYVYCGLFAAFLPTVWRERRGGVWTAYLALLAAVAVTMAILYLGPISAQRVPGLVAGWKNKFPNFSQPASVPGWIVGNTFLVFHYCYNPVGALFVVFAAVGVVRCWKHGRFDLACLCLGPVAACLLAAVAQVYPYSNNRLILFTAPGIGLIAGLGLSSLLESRRMKNRWMMPALAALLIVPEVALSGVHLVRPWLYPDGAGTTAFVNAQRQPGDLVASDEGNYLYFFFNEVRPLTEIASASHQAGHRVWVLIDHYSVEERRAYVRSRLVEADWELASETQFRKASVFLLVRRAR